MYQKDYILRMIDMLGDLIAGIIGFIKKGEYKQASEKLGKIYYDMLKEDAGFFRVIPKEDLIYKLLHEHNYTNGHLEILAELFNVEAELALAQGKKSVRLGYSEKSLVLFEYIDAEHRTYSSERLKKMAAIKERIEVSKAPDSVAR